MVQLHQLRADPAEVDPHLKIQIIKFIHNSTL